MSLVKTELNRFFSRRFILIMIVMLFAAFGVTVATVIATSERPTEAMWAQARQSADQQRSYLAHEYENCRNALTDKRQCENLNPAQVKPEAFLYGVFQFTREIKPLLYFLAAFLGLFGFLVTASFIGSELTSGGMTNLLLWRPQRMTVLGAKLGVALLSVAAIGVVYTTIYIGTFYGIAQTTGYTGVITPRFQQELAGLILRSIGIGLFASALAFAIATLGRHTAAALGAFLGYVIVWEGGARLVAELVTNGRGNIDPWFLSSYIDAWFTGEHRYYTGAVYYDHITSYSSIYLWHSAVVFLAIVGVLGLAAFFNFGRRDLA
jgi:ABC-2 type transport system permease protein